MRLRIPRSLDDRPNRRFFWDITCSIEINASRGWRMPDLSFLFNYLRPSNAPFHR